MKKLSNLSGLSGWILGALALMVGCPWLAVTFAGEAGMAVCFILFFALNPLFAIFGGLAAGKALRRLWCLPFVTAGAFLLGTWLFFRPLDSVFLLYAAVYLLLGLVAMGLRLLFKRLFGRHFRR